tara:strand:+ start:1084 stop:1350 length:267 start_codon:yes stop_codon:yes gene_type:complete
MVRKLVKSIIKRKTEAKEDNIYQRLVKIKERQRRKKMGKTIAKLLKKVVSEETLVSILLVVGDYLVELSSNDLDNKVWDKVKKALEKK